MKRVASLLLALGCGMVGVAHADDYNIYPIKESIQHSADRRYWVMEVIDTHGQRGSISVDAASGEYDAMWDGSAESGNVGPGTADMETEAITTGAISPIVPVIIVVATCAVLQARAQSLLAQKTEACYRSGGYASGGSVGKCGSMTGSRCHSRNGYHFIVE